MRHRHQVSARWVGAAAVGVALSMLMIAVGVPTGLAASDNSVGPHAYKVNIIGRPNDWQGSNDASGNVVWIGLKTNAESATCEDGSSFSDAGDDGLADLLPAGRQQIGFVGTTDGSFDVLDKDATDGRATIAIPANTGGYDTYIRVLGKPGGCLDADGYVLNSTGSYFLTGHIDANRKTGTPQKVLINDIFMVWLDTDGDGVADTEVSVFDSQFADYFWNIENNGLRLMQLIFVAR
jgi:hypothetical protein